MQTPRPVPLEVPDSPIARQAAELLRDATDELVFHHSHRVYYWAALRGRKHNRAFDPELLYVASMFHDFGLAPAYRDSPLRFEVDGAHAARDFLQGHGLAHADIDKVWMAIALHTTPGIPEFVAAEAELLQAGAGVDIAGHGYDDYSSAERDAVLHRHPREASFGRRVIDTFHQALVRRPMTTFGTFNDDFLAFKDPHFARIDLCSVILASPWENHD